MDTTVCGTGRNGVLARDCATNDCCLASESGDKPTRRKVPESHGLIKRGGDGVETARSYRYINYLAGVTLKDAYRCPGGEVPNLEGMIKRG